MSINMTSSTSEIVPRLPLARRAAATAGSLKIAWRRRSPTFALLLPAAILSCIGARSFYIYDQDRDFMKVERLLRGEWSLLLDGHVMNTGPLATLGGAFYAIMAPFMAISKDIRWLYWVIDALAFLSVIPARRWFRVFFSERAVDALSVLYVANAARMVLADSGYHPALTQLSIAAWQLVELRLIMTPTPWAVAAAIAIALINASLHLSTLPAVAVLPILWVASQDSIGWRRVARALEVTGIVACCLGAIWISYSLSSASIVAKLAQLDLTLDKLIGFETASDELVSSGGVYRGPLPGLLRLAVDLLLLGGVARLLWSRPLATNNDRLLRTWCVLHCLMFLAIFASYEVVVTSGAAFGIGTGQPLPSRYINSFYLTAMVLLFAAFDLLAGWLRRQAGAAILGCYVLSGLHLGEIALYRWRSQSAEGVGPPVSDAQFRLMSRALTKWNVSPGWLFSSMRVAGSIRGPFMPFYLDWFVHNHRRAGGAAELHPDMSLLVVRANSPDDRAGAAGAIDMVEADDLRAYLGAYTANTMEYREYFMGGRPLEFDVDRGQLYTKRDPEGRVIGYVMMRIQPPAEAFAELSYEIALDGGAGVNLGTYLELPRLGPCLTMSTDNDRVLGSRLRLLGRGGSVLAEVAYPIVVHNEAADAYAARAVVKQRFEDIAISDIEDVQIELKYHDPSHYPEPRVFRWSALNLPAWSPGRPELAWRKAHPEGLRMSMFYAALLRRIHRTFR